MTDQLSWAFALYDKMSVQADRMTAALERLDKQLGRARGEGSKLQNVFGGFGGPVGLAVGGLKWVASAAMGVASSIASVGEAFGSAMVEALAFKETTLIAFKSMLGGTAEANNAFERSVMFHRYSGFGSKDVIGQMKSIMGAGFSQKEAEVIFSGLADVAAVSGGGVPAMQSMLVQMAQAKSIGKFSMQDLKAIMSHAGPAGISLDALFTNLSKSTGVARAQVPAALTAGTITADQGIYAFMQTIQEKIDKGAKLGHMSGQLASGTISGLLNQLHSAPENLFFAMDLNSPGIKAFKGFLDNLVQVLNHLSEDGGLFQRVLGDIIDDVGGLFASLNGPEGMAKMEAMFTFVAETGKLAWDTIGSAFSEFWEALKPFVDDVMPLLGDDWDAKGGMKGAADAFVFLAIAAGKALGVMLEIVTLPARIGKALESLDQAGRALGKSIVDGLVDGLKTNNPLVNGALNALLGPGAGLVGTARELLDVHSPSGVFEDLGRQTAAGFSLGLGDGTEGVRQRMGELVAVPALARAGGARSTNVELGGVHITLNVAHGEDAEGLARRLGDLLPGELTTLFKRLADEQGT